MSEQEEDRQWEETWDAREAALTAILGKSDDKVMHAMIPLALGGSADVMLFPNYVKGMTYVTAELTGEDVGQTPNSLGHYELMICTPDESDAAADLISRLAAYTLETKLEPGETMDLPKKILGDKSIRALLFAVPAGNSSFTLSGENCGLLLCVGITKDELKFKEKNGSGPLLAKLRDSGVFPFTVPGRKSVLK